MNKLGMFLRMLRIEHNEVLFDMAKRLSVSSAFLSAVENDHKPAPLSWVETIASQYSLDDDKRLELEGLVYDSIRQIRVAVGNVPVNKRNCAIAFARSFDELSDNDVEELMSLLGKGRVNG